MATSAHSFSAPGSATQQASLSPPQEKRLRLWPAVILLVLLGVTRLIGYAFEEPPMALYQVIFFGPMIAAALTVLWWLLASRSRLRDRFLGFLLLAAAAGRVSYWFAHDTIQGMVYLFYTLPMALAAFLIPLVLLGRFSRSLATWVAVVASAVCFGGWALARNDGFSGDFKGAFDWRWKPTAGERFLADRTAKKEAAKAISGIGEVKWSEFRGPKRDGVVPGVRLNEDWTAHPPKQIWRRLVGPGWSSFAATDSLLWTQAQHGPMEAVVCYDANTGAEVWSHEYPSRFWEAIGGDGPRATPTLHDGAMFTLGANGELCRLDPRTGSVVWTRDLRKDADRDPPMWGFSASPLVTHGSVIVHAGGAGDKGTLAYDVQTGEPRWGAPAGDHSYSSPHLATVAGRSVVLMLTNTGLHAYDPATGKLQWDHEWKYEGYRVVQPLVVGESGVLLGTGMGSATRRIDLRPEGTGMNITERWTSSAMKPSFNDYVAHRGHLFGFDNTIFACIDLETGTKKWKEGRYGAGQVLLLPDGNQLLVTSEKGDLVLLRANPDRHEERARFPALQGKTWNHPILVGNRLYVRNGEEAACFELTLAGTP